MKRSDMLFKLVHELSVQLQYQFSDKYQLIAEAVLELVEREGMPPPFVDATYYRTKQTSFPQDPHHWEDENK
jgi:mannitol/fructose-specific phosphotransferase system IIA component (Ntr-type)